jgi:hypothetical protein
MMLLALSWADATVLGVIVCAIGFTIVVVVDHVVPNRGSVAAISPKKLDAIEDDVLAIRSDLADIKESLAELDRLFKSVG